MLHLKKEIQFVLYKESKKGLKRELNLNDPFQCLCKAKARPQTAESCAVYLKTKKTSYQNYFSSHCVAIVTLETK